MGFLSWFTSVLWPAVAAWELTERRGHATLGAVVLQAEALKLRKPLVSSVSSHNAKVVDGCGRVLTETSRWSRLLVHEICVQTEVFHSDGQVR